MLFGERNQTQEGVDVIEILKEDHRKVEALFEKFEDSDDEQEKLQTAQAICEMLTIHAELEEKLFYPAARVALGGDDSDLVDEAFVEHRSIKQLIAEIDGSSTSDDLFKANVKVLKEYVQHHVKEEEHELMPKISDLDLQGVGPKLLKLKEQLESRASERRPRASARRVEVPEIKELRGRGGKRGRSTKRGARRSTGASASRSGASARGNSSRRASASQNGRRGAQKTRSGRGKASTEGARSGSSRSTRGAAKRSVKSRGGRASTRGASQQARSSGGRAKSAR